ncbi:unnamed protein product [Arctogadus glacialis]
MSLSVVEDEDTQSLETLQHLDPQTFPLWPQDCADVSTISIWPLVLLSPRQVDRSRLGLNHEGRTEGG